ncbi:ATP-dependent metallopeptidase HflB [Leptotrichia sp. oral taxon 215 str. W9775]|uniref:ATP-dependent zinc metalloprotease FtsH n=1 Tax=Leptotrichia sp. oral taxon 215 TaxID=712359 RepID=UPI0003AD7E20|nr:ATP-dependent zinc metalloprotease FtsH [Leptotrichia sp. oral taxon 215]ERK66033.1 ATP-dependent metallopeptidase HflB [Leptotrichia sp. oral taxon 215 str. W9775]
MDDKNKDDIRKRLEELRKENNRKNGGNDGGRSPFFGSAFVFIMIIALFFAFVFYTQDVQNYFQEKKDVPYTEFVADIKSGKFSKIEEKDDKLIAVVRENNKNVVYSTRKITERVGNDPTIINAVNSKKVELVVGAPSQGAVFLALVVNFLPIIIMIILMIYLAKKMMGNGQGGPGNIFGFGKSRADKLDKKPDVKFDDVAGVDGAKEELKEVVDFLKNPEKYTKAGARVPKGVLLLGRPGTGKTLLAKAVAGESGASFFSISGSEFVEMFVGVGASRVRDLFEKAKSSSPSIIFIDEIDAIGRKRSVGKNSGSNDEREQTLNQLLVEMDGFETDAKVIVIAATNREDVLDPALLRAGRFDRRINVDAPDLQGRIAILKVHARNKKLASDVRLEDIAKITPGFVGADLANLLNEAAILAARKASDTITMEDLDEAVDKIGMGLGQKGKIIKPEEKRLLAYHEAGHAVMTELTPGADPVHKVTIIPRGDAGGFMMPLPEEKLVTTSKEMLAEIKVLFGGRAAEDLVLDDISTGAYSDIKRATRLARAYVESVGMSKKLGPVNLENSDEEFTFTSNKSNETIREIDLEIREILNNEYRQTVETLRANREKLDGIAELLLKKETITGDEVRKIISGVSVQELLNNSPKKDASDSGNKQENKTEEVKVVPENVVEDKKPSEVKTAEEKPVENKKEEVKEEIKEEKIEEPKIEQTEPEKKEVAEVPNVENILPQENNIVSEPQEAQPQKIEIPAHVEIPSVTENVEHTEFIEPVESIENIENVEQIAQPQNTENVENIVNEENILPQEIQEVKENLHEIGNNVQENPFETGNVPENIFEGNEETGQKHNIADSVTEELQVDTNNFSGISEGFVQEEVKAEENVISNDVENNDINEENSVKEEKKEKKIEIPSFMK